MENTRRLLLSASFAFIILFSVMSIVSATTVTISGENAGNNAIQSAINAAAPNTIINIGAGIYPEQLFINKSITIIGSGMSSTILAPTVVSYSPTVAAGLAQHVVNSLSIIYALNATNVTISNLAINGLETSHYVVNTYTGCLQGAPTNPETSYAGIAFINTSGTISFVNDSNIALGYDSGCQSQIGAITAISGHDNPKVIIRNDVVLNYTKQGISCQTNLTTGGTINCTLENTTVAGFGLNPNNGQTDVYYGENVNGLIINNTISGAAYRGSSYTSNWFNGTQAGGMVITVPMNISDNTCFNDDVCITAGGSSSDSGYSSIGVIHGNKILNAYAYGVVADGVNVNFTNNFVSNAPAGLLGTVDVGSWTSNDFITTNNIFNNVSAPYQAINNSGNVVMNIVGNGPAKT